MRPVLLAVLLLLAAAPPVAALPPVSTPLSALTASATTGEKPQSKVWTHDGRWWCVIPSSSGTWVWRLDGATWTSVLQLSASTSVHADVKAVGGVTHVLLFNGASTELASIEYVPASQTYQPWASRPANAAIALDGGTETATIDLDSQGRMWLATDRAAGSDQIAVYYSDAPYGTWSGPVTLATGIQGDDISALTAFPGGKIGVLWSNQNTRRFGFRTHVDGTDPTVWTTDEVPASQSALDVGLGMADDHLHVAVASDGTLYAAVKTSYDTSGYPKIALLVRRPGGTWDDLYEVDQAGTRAIVLLNEPASTVTVVYTSVEGSGNILAKESPTSSISFGSSSVLMPGGLNDPTSTKQNIEDQIVILAGNGSSASGVLRTGGAFTIVASAGAGGTITPSGSVSVDSGNDQTFTIAPNAGYHVANVLVDGATVGTVTSYTFQNVTANHTIAASFAPDVPPADLVGWWRMNGDLTDASSYANHATPTGSPTYTTGVNDQALSLSGSGQYASVPGNASLDITGPITMAVWFRPTKTGFATQRLVQKGTQSVNNGYELSLSSAGKVFVRFNQLSSGDNLRINSISSYPLNGTAWMHAAATFDGTIIRLYVNGVEEGNLTPGSPMTIGTNTTALTLGAMGNITNLFQGQLDDVRLYGRALSPTEIVGLMEHTITATAGANGSISPAGAVTVAHGGSQAFTITPDPGWTVASVLVDGVSVGAPTSYPFANVVQSHTIDATFAAASSFTITASAGPGGTVTPSGAVSVSNGGSQAFAIAPHAGFHIVDVLVDGGSVGPVASYTFLGVVANHTIAASFAPDTPPADLVGWWRMEGDVTDASTHGNHATAVGSPTFGPGVIDQALNLSGTGQYASVPSDASLDLTSQITMAAWFKPTKTGFATQRLIQKGIMNSNNGYELSLSSPGKVFVRFNQQSNGDAYRINSITSYPVNGSAWMHAAATFDGTTIRLYVNGVEEGSLTPGSAISIGTNPTALTIGAMGDFTNLFQGALDDVRLYNRALGAGEIAALAGVTTHTITATAGLHGSISPSGSVVVAQGASQSFTMTADPGYSVADVVVDGLSVGSPTGYTFTNVTQDHTIAATFVPSAPPAELVGHWPMEEGGGPDLLDASGHANHGTLLNGAAWVAGIQGLALDLDGSSQRGSVPDSPSLDMTSAITLATWVRPERMTTQHLVQKGANGGSDGYELSLATEPPGASGRPFVRFNQVSRGNLFRLDGTQLYPTDGTTWMHLAATYDGSAIKLYVDGVLDSSKAASFTIGTNALPLGIGSQSDGQFPFQGAMDEVRVYGRALDAAEIQALASHSLVVGSVNGSVTRSPDQPSYLHHTSVSLTAIPDPGYEFAGWSGDATGTSNPIDVIMDADRSVVANFVASASATVNAISPGGVISLVNPSVTVPVRITRTTGTPVLGFSVDFAVSSELTTSPSAMAIGPFLTTVNPNVSFEVIDHGGGHYTADGVTLGAPCGASALDDVLFTLDVGSVMAGGTGTVTIEAARLRDCANDPLLTAAGSPASVAIDRAPPAVAVTSPDGGEFWLAGSAHDVAWTASDLAGIPADGVDLAYSTDGIGWTDIATGVANAGTHSWALPTLVSTTTLVRVTVRDANGNSSSDVSGAAFTIAGATTTMLDATPDPGIFDETLTLTATVSPIAAGGSVEFFEGATPLGDVPLASGTATLALTSLSVGSHALHAVYGGSPEYAGSTSGAVTREVKAKIVSSAGAGGSISPSGTVLVSLDETPAFAFAADPGYHVSSVTVDGSPASTTSPYTFAPVSANHTIAVAFEVNPPVAPITTLTASQARSGNDEDGTIEIRLHWDEAIPAGSTVEVFRARYGHYPQYDEAGGTEPTAPAYPPAAPWEAAGVLASDETDEVSNGPSGFAGRDVWYYVAFVKDLYGTTSPASNLSEGRPNYLLGDVSDGTIPGLGRGDNVVDGADISALGDSYGFTGGAVAAVAYLDVGPTTDFSVEGRPLTDAAIDFEDLVIFAINYGTGPAPQLVAGATTLSARAGVDRLMVSAPARVAAGEEFAVRLRLEGTGRVQALSTELGWAQGVVEPVSVEVGEWLGQLGGVALSPQAGAVDVALLGVGARLEGEGEVVVVWFRALQAGEPRVTLGAVKARDLTNHEVEVATAVLGIPAPRPTVTQLSNPFPNPSRAGTTIAFSLALSGPVAVVVYGVDGRAVRTLAGGPWEPGVYRLNWDGRDDQGRALSPGIYFVQLTTAGGRLTRRVTVLR